MKKIMLLCCFLVLTLSLLCAQAQAPGFSNTVHAAFGQPIQRDSKIQFFGFTDYFTGNITVGKLVFAGDIAWQLIPGSRGIETKFADHNVNVVINPVRDLHIGLGTNLNWTVGPGPSSGPAWSAHGMPYYGGINLQNSAVKVSGDVNYPKKGFEIKNYYAQKAFALRYKYQNIFELGFSLPAFKDVNNFNAGVGIKANVQDKFGIGFAYNGPFNAGENYLYLGITTSALKGLLIGAYWNLLTDTAINKKDGANTLGAVIDFKVKKFRIKPEGAITFWTDTDWGPAAYLAVNANMDFTKDLLGGLNASWGLGSDLVQNDPDNRVRAGARLDFNPYILWTVNEANSLSAGVQLTPLFWTDGAHTFSWQIPIAWKVRF